MKIAQLPQHLLHCLLTQLGISAHVTVLAYFLPHFLPFFPHLSPFLCLSFPLFLPLCLRFALHFWLIAVTRLPMLEILHLPSCCLLYDFLSAFLSFLPLSIPAALLSSSPACLLHSFIHSSVLHMFLQRTFNYDRNFHFICSSTDFYSNPFISFPSLSLCCGCTLAGQLNSRLFNQAFMAD